MPKKRFTAEQIIPKLREAEVDQAKGRTVAQACKKIGVPLGTFTDWMGANDALGLAYARARIQYIETLAAETISISDEDVDVDVGGRTDTGAVQRNRLRVDSRKWLLSKLKPEKYGERLTLAGDEANPLVISKVERVVINGEPRKQIDNDS